MYTQKPPRSHNYYYIKSTEKTAAVATDGNSIKVIIGVDNHKLRYLGDNVLKQGISDAHKLGLNIIDFLEI